MQLELPISNEQTLKSYLEAQTGLSIALTITNNRSSMLSFVPNRGNSATLRLHRMFLSANAEVLHALALWLKRGKCRRSARVLDQFIDQHRHLIDRAAPKNRVRRHTSGIAHNLDDLYDAVNDAHFGGTLDVPITWSREPAKKARARRSIRFGSYSPEDHLIRIHPYLDHDDVPEFFVRYIVFHEMLHAYLGIETLPSGRRVVHSKEFCRIEKAYPDYDRAIAWLDDPYNLQFLLKKRAS